MNVYQIQKLINSTNRDDRAIINYNNDIIITNNDKIVNCCTPECDKEIMKGPPVTTGLASLSAPQDIPPQVEVTRSGVGNLQNLYYEETIPANWEYIKLDLYDNASPEELAQNKSSYKLAINIKKTGHKDWVKLMAGLNTEIRFMKRGLDAATWDTGHYWNVRQSYQELKSQCVFARASKTYLAGYRTKGQTVADMSVVFALVNRPNEYYINLHFQEQQWLWILRGSAGYLSNSQRRKNIIATAGVRRGNTPNIIRAGDIL